jgi:hypothetical protein
VHEFFDNTTHSLGQARDNSRFQEAIIHIYEFLRFLQQQKIACFATELIPSRPRYVELAHRLE